MAATGRPQDAPSWGAVIGTLVAAAAVVGGLVFYFSSTSGDDRSDDPVEQARVVLGGEYSYDAVQSVTDAALAATDTIASDENRSRAWSAVLSAADGHGLNGFEVMQCVARLGEAAAASISIPESTALCVVEMTTP